MGRPVGRVFGLLLRFPLGPKLEVNSVVNEVIQGENERPPEEPKL